MSDDAGIKHAEVQLSDLSIRINQTLTHTSESDDPLKFIAESQSTFGAMFGSAPTYGATDTYKKINDILAKQIHQIKYPGVVYQTALSELSRLERKAEYYSSGWYGYKAKHERAKKAWDALHLPERREVTEATLRDAEVDIAEDDDSGETEMVTFFGVLNENRRAITRGTTASAARLEKAFEAVTPART